MAVAGSIYAQQGREPGKSLGAVTVKDNLIVMTLDEGVLGKANLFDLQHHTIRFTPDGTQYRVENVPFHFDADFGPEMSGSQVTLKNFEFPFSGKNWNTFSVGMTGSIAFAEPAPAAGRGAGAGAGRGRGGFGGRGGGISVDRFAELAGAGRTIINTMPAISVFFKPRMSGTRYLKELPDRAVVSWSLTEPVGGVQDMYWHPTENKFQAVLHKDGVIEMSWDAVHAEDAIVGVYPLVNAGQQKEIGSVNGEGAASAPANIDIKSVKLSAVDGLFLKATLETRGPVPAEGDASLNGVSYRVCLSLKKPAGECAQNASDEVVWTIRGGAMGGRTGRGGAAGPRYFVSGAGVSPQVKVEGSSISLEGTLPTGFKSGDAVYVSASAQASGSTEPASRVRAQTVKLANLSSPEVHLASVKKEDGPFPVVFEAFHYLKPTRAEDLTCTVIKALGDKFDMLAYYSDFRIDNPEAGTSSNGPLGGGPNGGAVTGIGANQHNLAGYCSQGRFQWQFIQPVWVNANQMQEYPPADVKENNRHNVPAYTHQLSERTSNGKIPPYDYAMSQIGHEMGHRWSAFVSAKVGNETIQLGPTHWTRGLQAPVAFPYQRPTEASAMGGGVWQDNYDGSFTQLDDDYYVPATGWSYLDLYLMGLIGPSEVPDFFILRNLTPAGEDVNGRPIFKADRTKVTIQDVIAVEGPRLPDVDHSQKDFNTGMVVVVEHGKTPSKELLERTEGIRLRWMDYWETTTGHRSKMTTNPK
ncbi:MAG TPA: hypothetical protein VHW24_28045 [Bryobacteraceae bacterium]|nr:hypothetical protein [Bryobacteraceae bacterium]